MQPDSETEPPPSRRGNRTDAIDLVRDLRRRLTPGQVLIDGIDRDIDPRIRRSAEIKRRMRLLYRPKQ
jgi:hypothetical protein